MDELKYNDYELLYMIRQKDETAFTILINKYENLAWMLIYKYIGTCKTGLLADDYMQMARLKLLQAVDDYREDQESSFCHYFCRIFRNHLIDCYRRRMHDLQPISLDFQIREDDAVYCLMDFIEKPQENFAVSYEFAHRLKTQKAQLKPLEKQIVDLRALGYTYRQIADILNVNIKKVDNTLQKVRSDTAGK